MMKRLRLLGFVLLAIGGCGSGQRPDLTVTTYSPTRTAGEATPIEVSFDRPVIEDAEVGTAVDAAAVTVSPAVPWTGRWRDRHTLVIEPSEPLKASTRYQVALAGELARRTGGFQFAFVHQPLEVEGIAGADPEALPVDGAWRIGFNHKVTAAAAAGACSLTGMRGTIALVAQTPDEIATDITMKPEKALDPDASYTLRCAG